MQREIDSIMNDFLCDLQNKSIQIILNKKI